MKKNLILIICFLDITFPSTESLNEKMSSYPSTVQMQKRKPNNLISLSGTRPNENTQRTFNRIGSMDSNCLKNLYNQFRSKNRSGYRRPYEVIKLLRMPAIRNDGSNQQIPNFYKRYNLLKDQDAGKPFGNDRIIFLPPYAKSSNERVNFFKNLNEYKINETSQSNSQENLSNEKSKKVRNEIRQKILVKEYPKQTEENIKYVKTFPSNEENSETEKQYTTEYSTVFDEPEVSKAIEPSDFRTSEIPQKSKSTTETYSNISPHYFRPFPQKKPTQSQPYEVEEIIEEGLSINLDGEKTDNVKSIPFDGSAIVAKEIKKVTNSGNAQKMNGIQDMMGSSINTVIKTLMSPMMKIFPTVESNREIFSKEKVQNRPAFNNYFTSPSPHFKTFPGQDPENFHKTINNDRLLPNRYEQSKHLKVKNPQINEKFQTLTQQTISIADTKKITSELINESKDDVISPLKIEYSKNVGPTSTTEILYTLSGASKTEKNILNLKKNSQQTTTAMTETENVPLPFSEPSDQISFTLFENRKIPKSFTTQNTLNINIENSSTVSSTSQTTINKILSSQEFSTEKSTEFDEFTENSTEAKTFSEVQYIRTDEPPSEMVINISNLTNFDFQGFVNHPTTFDLITTIKSDFKRNQDAIGKNGRKMHFRNEIDKTTRSSQIIELGNTGPRRSDILITENFSDYVEDDNNLSALNYLDKLKQNNSFPNRNSLLHPDFESIMPLIPVVVNDLREGRISTEDVPILSKAFGKYWSSVMVLLNATNLDMLPLLKMKNEEDWNNIWQSFLLETTKNTELTIIQTTETNPKQEGEDYSPYDYVAEYEDFYEYVFESEKEKEKKRKKARLKRDGKNELKKPEAFQEYSESTDEEENSITGNNIRGNALH